MITTCSRCFRLYEEHSREEADSPNRLCLPCFTILRQAIGDLAELAIQRAQFKADRLLRDKGAKE